MITGLEVAKTFIKCFLYQLMSDILSSVPEDSATNAPEGAKTSIFHSWLFITVQRFISNAIMNHF